MKKTVDEILRQYVDALPRDKDKDLQKFYAGAVNCPARRKKSKERTWCPAAAPSCALAAVLCVCLLGGALLYAPGRRGEPGASESGGLEEVTLPTPPNVAITDEDAALPAPGIRTVSLADSLGKTTQICDGVLQSAGIHLRGEVYLGYNVCLGESAEGSSGSAGIFSDILEEFYKLSSSTNHSVLSFYMAQLGKMEEYAFLGSILEPTTYASQISVSPLQLAAGSSHSTFGALLQLSTLEPGAVRSIDAFYVAKGYQVEELGFYEALEDRTQWMGREICYAVYGTEEEYTYRLYFQNADSYCCMRVRSLERLEISELLAAVFG